MITLEDKVIVITGAGQGIGYNVAKLCLELGAAVVALDLKAEGLESLQSEAGADRVFPVVGTVADSTLANTTVAEAISRFGAIHGLVNNAGIVRPAMIEKMTDEQWQEVLDVHLTGAFYWTRAVGKHMVERTKQGSPGGSIVNISSDAGRRGAIGQINYSAAKAGMLGMTMTAAKEWGRYGIRSNSICFGVVETPMTEVVRGEKFRDAMLAQIPLGRWASTAEVSQSVVFLLSDAASYTTGQHYGVNGGFHISV